MRLIKKKDLKFEGNFLLTKEGNIVCNENLAEQFNSIIRMADIIEFALENEEKILASGVEFITYDYNRIGNQPVIPFTTPIPTPKLDKAIADQEAIASEWLDKKANDEVKEHLLELDALAVFFASDYVQDHGGEISSFNGNPLELTPERVVDVVTQYYHPAIVKLRKLLRYQQ